MNASEDAPAAPDIQRKRTLLLVDDEASILTSLRRLLRKDGYEILFGNSGEEGLALLTQYPVDVILSDQRMPNMTGVEFLRRVKTAYPDTVRMVLSGYTELQSITDAINEGAIYKFLTKPWDDEQLRANIAEAFRYKELADDNKQLHEQVRIANRELAAANERLQVLLAERERQLALDGASLDIAQEILQHVQLPVIGFDDEGMIVFSNILADRVIGKGQPLVGTFAADRLPAALQPLLTAEEDAKLTWSDGDRDWQVSCRSMGEDSPSHGKLMLFVFIERNSDEPC